MCWAWGEPEDDAQCAHSTCRLYMFGTVSRLVVGGCAEKFDLSLKAQGVRSCGIIRAGDVNHVQRDDNR